MKRPRSAMVLSPSLPERAGRNPAPATMTIRRKRMKWSRTALASAAAVGAVVGMSGLAPLPAKAGTIFISTWVNITTLTGPTPECLGVLNGDMTNGTPVVSFTCNGHPDQSWEINNPPGSNTTSIHNFQNPGKCLGVLASGTSNGSQLVIWDCNGSSDQNWTFQGPGTCFRIMNQNAAPKVLGILGGNVTDFGQAVIWDDLTHPDQSWCPVG